MSDQKSLAIIPRDLAAVSTMSKGLANSTIIPPALRGKSTDIATIILRGLELGLTPMQAVSNIHLISGKPVLAADLIAALAIRSPHCKYLRLVESTPQKAVYETLRDGHPCPTSMAYTIEEAKAAGLLGKDNWRNFPADMLRARAKARICREVYPEEVMGLYAPEEFGGDEDAPVAAPPSLTVPVPPTGRVLQEVDFPIASDLPHMDADVQAEPLPEWMAPPEDQATRPGKAKSKRGYTPGPAGTPIAPMTEAEQAEALALERAQGAADE